MKPKMGGGGGKKMPKMGGGKHPPHMMPGKNHHPPKGKPKPAPVTSGNNGCTGCNSCIDQVRSDVVAAYRSWGHTESCDSIINDWCNNLDPSSCASAKSSCSGACGAPSGGMCSWNGQSCSDTYQETQNCASSGKSCPVNCHKSGSCMCVGDGTCCSWGAGSYCDDPCAQAACASTNGGGNGNGNVVHNGVWNTYNSAAQNILNNIASTCGATVSPLAGGGGHSDFSVDVDFRSCFDKVRSQSWMVGWEFIWHPGTSHCSSMQHLHILNPAGGSHGIDGLYQPGPNESPNYPPTGYGTCQWLDMIGNGYNWCCYHWF